MSDAYALAFKQIEDKAYKRGFDAAWRKLDALQARITALEAELEENEGVIRVWRRRAMDAEAERDAALSAAGYAVVPVEPTEAMLRAGANRWQTHHPGTSETYPNERATWRAMLAAANPPDTKKPAETDPAG